MGFKCIKGSFISLGAEPLSYIFLNFVWITEFKKIDL